MRRLRRGSGDRRAGGAVAWPARCLFLGLSVSLALGSGTAIGQVSFDVQVAPAEGPPAEAAAPDAPEDEQHAMPVVTPEEAARQQIDQMAAQYEPVLTRVLQAELELLRQLHGDLPLEARRNIVAAGEKAVKEGALRLSEAIHAPQPMPVARPPGAVVGLFNAVGRAFGFPVEAPARNDTDAVAEAETDAFDPCQLVIDAVAESLVEQIGRDQGADFLDELTKREQRRDAAAIRRIVGILDDDLFLSSKQREAIVAALGEEWDEGFAMAVDHQMQFNGVMIYPGLPYDKVLPHLSPAQRAKLGDGRQARDIVRMNRHSMLQSRLFRRANLAQQAERDPWWFE